MAGPAAGRVVLSQAALYLARPVTSYRALALGADPRRLRARNGPAGRGDLRVLHAGALVPARACRRLLSLRAATLILSRVLISWMVPRLGGSAGIAARFWHLGGLLGLATLAVVRR